MERIEGESFGLFCPGLADMFVGREALERLEALGEIVSADEVAEMASQLLVGLVEEAFDRRLLDGAVHALDLTVGPGVPGLGEAMIDIVLRAGEFESVSAEDLVPVEHDLDLGRSPAIAAGLGEVRAIAHGESGLVRPSWRRAELLRSAAPALGGHGQPKGL